MSEVRKIIPSILSCDPPGDENKWECIFFKVPFNSFRDVSRSTANEVIDREEMQECEGVLALPANYSKDGEPVPLVISCHGAGSTVCAEDGRTGGVAYSCECLKNGFAVMDVSGSQPHGLTMGCSEHVFALYKAYRYVVTHFNVSRQVLVSGGSMGGHTALNFANTFPSIVLALGLFYPRINIDGDTIDGHYCIGTWDKTKKGASGLSTHDHVVKNFRFPEDAWCEENTIGFNPYRARCYVNQDGKRVVIPPCPVKLWQGDADTTVDPVMTREFAASIRRAGCYVEYHELEGVGHKLNNVMYRELLYWFNRFV